MRSEREAVRYLDSLIGSGIRPGLTRMRALLRAEGSPHRKRPTVIVAGTNGKGSTAATLSAIVQTAGYRAGLYTSPHLVELRERWRIGEMNVDADSLVEATTRLRGAARKSGIRPTYFEALTCLAFFLFEQHQCELDILEVGLGGRLDATNVTRPLLALISRIAIDHREFLGNTIRSVAREKAGVIHRGSIALTSNDDPVILEVIARRAAGTGSPVHLVHEETSADRIRPRIDEISFRLTTPHHTYRLGSPLPGLHQLENVSLAVRAAEELRAWFPGIDVKAIERGVAATRWRARLERFAVGGKTVLVDGGHNENGAATVAPFLDRFAPRPRVLVFGMMKDKDVAGAAQALFPLFDRLIVTRPDPQRGLAIEDEKRLAADFGVPVQARTEPVEALITSTPSRRPLSLPQRGSRQ